MNNNIKFAVVGLCALGMSSCVILENGTSDNLYYTTYAPYDDSRLYSQNNYKMPNANYTVQSKQDVIVPDSYHVGEMRPPVSFQDRDQTWVSSQNPQGYTIELAEGEKASKVAQALYKAPKTNRMAQVRYLRDGKDYYRGVYGSYGSADEAKKALDSLPLEIKSSASVKNWSNIQQSS
jgi:hypothetical protein